MFVSDNLIFNAGRIPCVFWHQHFKYSYLGSKSYLIDFVCVSNGMEGIRFTLADPGGGGAPGGPMIFVCPKL